MTISIADPEQWYAAYEAASTREQYDILLDTLSQPLTSDLADELDLGILLAMMRDELVNHNQLEKAIALIRALQQQQPELHQTEFLFLDSLLIEYFLYKDDPDQVREGLRQFLLYPAEDVDQTLMILDYLSLYEAKDLVIELSQAAYEPVKQSPNVIRGTEMEFSKVLLHHQMQQAYEQLQQGELVDWDTFLEEAVRYGFPKKPKWITEIQNYLTTPVQNTPPFLAQFKRDRSAALQALSLGFYQYMAERKQMSFICSAAIWETVINFLDNRQIPSKKLSQPQLYFTFEQDDLEHALMRMIGGFLSMAQARGFGMLWGMPYVYDFLLVQEMISNQVYQRAMTSIQNLKGMVVEKSPKLWRFAFVHRWQPPESVSARDFEAEASQFAASLEPVTPLSKEPGKGVTHQSFLDTLKEQMPPEIQAAFEQAVEEEKALTGEEEEEDDYVPPIIRFREPADYEPSKKRKSTLKLAAELPENRMKSPKRKKKR